MHIRTNTEEKFGAVPKGQAGSVAASSSAPSKEGGKRAAISEFISGLFGGK